MKLSIQTAIVFLVVPLTVHAQKPDAIAKRLDQAKAQFAQRVAAARSKLDSAVGTLIDRTNKNRRLSTDVKIQAIDALKKDRLVFQESGKAPSSRQLRSAVSTYERVLNVETDRVRDAFDDAAKAYDRSSNLDAARTVLEERDEFLKSARLSQAYGAIDAGAVWKGIRSAKPSGTRKPSVLIIETRTADSFSGKLSVTNPKLGENVSKIKGVIKDRVIHITGVDGLLGHPFTLTGKLTTDGLVLNKEMKPPASQVFTFTLVSSLESQPPKNGITK